MPPVYHDRRAFLAVSNVEKRVVMEAVYQAGAKEAFPHRNGGCRAWRESARL